MSYLDQLKQQATDVEEEKKAEGQTEGQLTAIYDTKVRPRLEKAYQYFHEVTQQLAKIQPKTPVHYELPGVGPLLKLFQDEYILSSYHKVDDDFFVRMFSHGELKQRFEVKSIAKMEEYKDYLWKHNTKFKYRQVNDAKSQFLRAVFEIQGEVVAQINFKGNLENSGIEVHTQNFPVLGKETYLVPVDHFSDDFFDQLAMFITRANVDNPLKSYKISHTWAGKARDAKQIQREKILAELKQHEAEEKQAKALEKEMTKPVKKIKKPQHEAEKTGFFSSLFGKK